MTPDDPVTSRRFGTLDRMQAEKRIEPTLLRVLWCWLRGGHHYKYFRARKVTVFYVCTRCGVPKMVLKPEFEAIDP